MEEVLMRTGRIMSESSTYHIVQKGAGGQILFESDFDRLRYLKILDNCLDNSKCTLYAWCLMSNHVHLLIRSELEQLSYVMHGIGTSYAMYFNTRHGHDGPVFQDRFYSEPVETDEHFLAAIRYIHNNPMVVGIGKPWSYNWSSYWEYINKPQRTETSFALDILGGVKEFEHFSEQPDTFQSTIDHEIRTRLDDESAYRIAKEIFLPLKPREIKLVAIDERRKLLEKLRDAGIGVSQASRITGLGKATISRIYNTK